MKGFSRMHTGQAIILLVLGILYPTWERLLPGDWRFYTSGEFGSYLYDAGNVTYLPNSIVRVSQKLVLSDRGTATLVREIGEKYEKVKEIITIREISCEVNKIHILGLAYVSDNGRVIKRESYEPIDWDPIIPDSVDAILYHAVCEPAQLF